MVLQRLVLLTAIGIGCLLGTVLRPRPAETAPDEEPVVVLDLTYPAGRSPRVFTRGWVFGAHGTMTTSDGQATDISAQVAWSGTGTFVPARGPLSHPAFKAPGANSITLTVVVGKRTVTKSWSVTAVSPKPAEGAGTTYAKLGDLAECTADAHGGPACPHHVIGPIIAGSPTVTIDGLPAARKGDRGVHASCCGPHVFRITGGDATVLIDGKTAARVGDETTHCGGMGKIVGPARPYYAVFVITQPKLKPGRKIQRGEDEKDEAWRRRKAAWLRRLGVGDFTFDQPADESKLLLMHIEGDGLLKYPFLEKRAKYALHVQGNASGGQGGRVAGSVLLTCKGTGESLPTLRAAIPTLKGPSLEKMLVFKRGDGTTTHAEDKRTFRLGPLTKGWSDAAKRDNVELYKAIAGIFDCFIANAVYGNPVAPDVMAFRLFRERVLRRTAAGRRLIDIYNAYGPGYAHWLRDKPGLRPVLRWGLHGIANWVRHLDLEDPAQAEGLDTLVRVAAAIASTCWTHRERGPLEGLSRAGR